MKFFLYYSQELLDKLFESRPELEKFIREDTREINVKHIDLAGRWKGDTMTRAACYNNEMGVMDKWKRPEFVTKLRREIIAPSFPELEQAKDHYIWVNTHDVPEIDTAQREKMGALIKKGPEAILKSLTGVKIDDPRHNELVNLMLQDALPLSHPQKDNYAAGLRQRLQEADGFTVLPPEAKTVAASPKNIPAPYSRDEVHEHIYEDRQPVLETPEREVYETRPEIYREDFLRPPELEKWENEPRNSDLLAPPHRDRWDDRDAQRHDFLEPDLDRSRDMSESRREDELLHPPVLTYEPTHEPVLGRELNEPLPPPPVPHEDHPTPTWTETVAPPETSHHHDDPGHDGGAGHIDTGMGL